MIIPAAMRQLADVARRLQEIVSDEEAFIHRLKIMGTTNRIVDLDPFLPEQEAWARTIFRHRMSLGIKPRQVGFTTVSAAYIFYLLYTSPDPEIALSVVHELDAIERLHMMHGIFHDGLPPELQYGFSPDNLRSQRFQHNKATARRLLAGGRGQGRSWTANHLHATEMAKWPRASAADTTSEASAGGSDEEVFASVMATVHDEGGRIIVESTGNGPHGIFYDLYEQAKEDPEWGFVFIPWTAVDRYRVPLDDLDAIELEKDLDDEETDLVKNKGVTLPQIAWRRRKMRTLKMTPIRFKREYPLTDLEPFLTSESGWFDIEVLLELLAGCEQLKGDDPVVRFRPAEPGRRYALGVDTAGGTGGDEASITVLRDDWVEVCHWSSEFAKPPEQARMLARLAAEYGPASGSMSLANIEANKYGVRVIARAEEAGVPLWRREDGDYWWTSQQSKRDLFDEGREWVDSRWVILKDAESIRQMTKIVEKPGGQIEPSGKSGKRRIKDDRCMSKMLAIKCGATFFPPISRTGTHPERDRIRAVREKYGRADATPHYR